MGKRIQKLLKQAGFTGISPEVAGKLAELITQECREDLRYGVLNTQELRRDKSTDYQVGWEDGLYDAAEMIKELWRA